MKHRRNTKGSKENVELLIDSIEKFSVEYSTILSKCPLKHRRIKSENLIRSMSETIINNLSVNPDPTRSKSVAAFECKQIRLLGNAQKKCSMPMIL